MILTAGRDHRMRLWDAHTGANRLVHYAGAYNTARQMRQLGVSAAGGPLRHSRVYFPTADGLAVYELLSGRKIKVRPPARRRKQRSPARPSPRARDAQSPDGGADLLEGRPGSRIARARRAVART